MFVKKWPKGPKTQQNSTYDFLRESAQSHHDGLSNIRRKMINVKFGDKCQVSRDNHEDRKNGIFPKEDNLDAGAEKEIPNRPRRSI